MSSGVIPTMRYPDAGAAIDRLCDTFGFERNAVHSDRADDIAHAQLTFGGGTIMMGSVRDDAFGRLQAAPDPDAPVTQSAFVVVPDAYVVHSRAIAAGAGAVDVHRDEEHGGRGYSCCDPEGHHWNFRTYDLSNAGR